MIAEFSIENFFSIKSAQKISFEPSSDTFMSDEYSYEVKDGVRLLKVGIIYGANASGKTNILNAIDFFRMLVLRMPKDRNVKTGVIPFMLDDISRNEKTKMSMVFYINQSKYILNFELDEKHIYSETLVVYESIRPAKLYTRSYDADTDSTTIEFGANLKMAKKSQDIIGVYRRAAPLLNGYAPVSRDGKFGLLDSTGAEFVPCAYDGLVWDGGTAWVRLGDGWHEYSIPGVTKPDPLADLPESIVAPDTRPTRTDIVFFSVDTAGERLNVRTGPGLEYDILDKLSDSAQVRLYGALSTAPGWALVKYGRKFGWVSQDFLVLGR